MHISPMAFPLTLLQAPYGMTDSQVTWLIVFTALVAVAVLIQAVALGAMAFMVVKLLGKVTELTSKLETKVWPLMDTARDLVNDSVPKIKRVTNNIADTSDLYRAKVTEIDSLITDTSKVYRAKMAEVDALVTDTGKMYRSKMTEIDTLITDAAEKAKKQSDRVDGMVSTVLTTAGSAVDRVEHTVKAPFRQGAAVITGIKTAAEQLIHNFSGKKTVTPQPVAFEGDSVYTGLEDDYHA